METARLYIAEEFEQLYNEQFPLVYNYIFFRIGHAADAEDLTADVFVRAYQYWGSFAEHKGTRGVWIGGIARNMVNTYLGKKNRSPPVANIVEFGEFLGADADTESEFFRIMDINRILLLIAKLPDNKRELLAMKYTLGLTNREIARITGMGESAVSKSLCRTLEELRERFAKLSPTF